MNTYVAKVNILINVKPQTEEIKANVAKVSIECDILKEKKGYQLYEYLEESIPISQLKCFNNPIKFAVDLPPIVANDLIDLQNKIKKDIKGIILESGNGCNSYDNQYEIKEILLIDVEKVQANKEE